MNNKRIISRLLAGGCLCLLAACTQAPAPAPAESTVDHAAAENSVRAAANAFKLAISQRDVDKVLSFYASDGWQLAFNGAIARTDAERRTYWNAIAALPIAQDIVDVSDRLDVANSGDLAVQYGEFRQLMFDKKGNSTSMPQKFINSWRKQADGSWKVTASMASVGN